MNLHLRFTAFGSEQEVGLYQTPTGLVDPQLPSEQVLDTYVKWLLETRHMAVNPDVLEHIEKVRGICRTFTHRWFVC